MVSACLDAGIHYIDVTGEIDVFDAVFARHDDAVAAGVVLLPGAGFDVVPTDCVAATLFEALPTATTLELAFVVGGGMSPGTMKTALAGMGGGGRVRRGGVLVPVPTGQPRRRVPFPSGERGVASIRWGDLVTAYRSTGIPDITTYTALPSGGRGARMTSVLAWAPLLALARRYVTARVHGPNPATRSSTGCEVWGEVRDPSGASATMTLTGPNPYDLTADSVVEAVRRLLAGTVAPGAHTPVTAFGPTYAGTLTGVTLSTPPVSTTA
jgi:short subunit dehydrogenase-like uncharacterized protein